MSKRGEGVKRTKTGQTGAAERRRLGRIRELAQERRATERAFARAIAAAHEAGISVRKIAQAAGIGHMQVWRVARPGAGQPGLSAEDVRLPKQVNKPKGAGK